MANIPLKTITFPGLPDKYTVPEISNDLMTAGKAADAKATGDALSALEDAVTEETDKLKADLDNLGGKGLTEAQIDLLDAIGDHISFLDSTGGILWDELIASLRAGSEIVVVKEGSSLIISGVNDITNIIKNGTVLELRGGV